jgi:hypothetical protein
MVWRLFAVPDRHGRRSPREVLGVLERLVLEPSDVEARLVTGYEVVVREPLEPLRLDALRAVVRRVGGDEVLEVLVAKRLRLEREVLVRPEVVDPKRSRPRRLRRGFRSKNRTFAFTPGR